MTLSRNGTESIEPASLGRYFAAALLCLLGVALVSGCTSTKITDREQFVKGPIPRPNQILVYDFAATLADVPAYSSALRRYSVQAKPQTPEQIATGRKIGTELAEQLAKAIDDMGMPGIHATQGTKPEINDLILRGYLVSVDEGSELKRLTIGFGSGSSLMEAAVEGFQMTAQGPRALGAGVVDAGGGGKGPGAVVGGAVMVATASPIGLIVSSAVKVGREVTGSAKIEGRVKQTVKEIAGVLKQRFQEAGWIE
ncbi:MAG: DUF4410 domain-containing protein [Nitrococcus sp.]|nr:DUF4410 domain-containing protein [Nitrococcus sp.]